MKKKLTSGLWYQDDGTIAMTRCPDPECKRENYCMNVLSGICTWCGYDSNRDKEFIYETKQGDKK